MARATGAFHFQGYKMGFMHSMPALQWAPSESATLCYQRTGQGATTPLLLVHEMGGTSASWAESLPIFGAERHVIACDLRGAGHSEKIRAALAVSDFADDLPPLLDALGCPGPVDVVGVGLGGCIALFLASRHPARVRRLVPVNPPTHANAASGKVLSERAELADKAGMRAIADATLARSWPPEVMEDGEKYRRYRAQFVTLDPTSYAYTLRALAGIRFDGVLESIRCPTLFLAGRHDRVRPPAATAEAAARVKNAAFREIGAGHVANVQAPAEVAQAVLDFVRP